MEGTWSLRWRGAKPLIGTAVGVGIFGLPFAFAQVGYVIGLAELLLVGGLNLVAMLLYADLVLLHRDHKRFVGVTGVYLGIFGRGLASLAYLGSHLGAMIAYILIGGGFAYTVFSPLLGGQLAAYQIAFWFLGSVMIFGGLFFVEKVQAYIIPFFFLLVVVLCVTILPSFNIENVTTLHPENAILPLGVILFAASGMSAIPEMRDMLGKNQGELRSSIVTGTLAVGILYIFFTLAIVGLTGANTTPQALDGVGAVAGSVLVLLGSVIGMCTVFSSFMTIGVAMTNTLFYDRHFGYLYAWLTVAGVPIVLFLFGARNFIDIIGFTGGVMSAILGMLLVVAYERARMSAALPKRALGVPQWLVFMSFSMFVAMFVLTIWEMVR